MRVYRITFRYALHLRDSYQLTIDFDDEGFLSARSISIQHIIFVCHMCRHVYKQIEWYARTWSRLSFPICDERSQTITKN